MEDAESVVDATVDALRRGGVVVIPTDTVYGLACAAFNAAGVATIYALKGRSYDKPLPILLPRADGLFLVGRDVPRETLPLVRAFWPGPLTLVVKTSPAALVATRGKDTVAVRVPNHPFVAAVLARYGLPIAATSANPSGKPPATTGEAASRLFKGRVDVIVDAGACDVGRPSAVVDAAQYPFTVLREGALSKAALLDALTGGCHGTDI